jgi:hypothetical protein
MRVGEHEAIHAVGLSPSSMNLVTQTHRPVNQGLVDM